MSTDFSVRSLLNSLICLHKNFSIKDLAYERFFKGDRRGTLSKTVRQLLYCSQLEIDISVNILSRKCHHRQWWCRGDCVTVWAWRARSARAGHVYNEVVISDIICSNVEGKDWLSPASRLLQWIEMTNSVQWLDGNNLVAAHAGQGWWAANMRWSAAASQHSQWDSHGDNSQHGARSVFHSRSVTTSRRNQSQFVRENKNNFCNGLLNRLLSTRSHWGVQRNVQHGKGWSLMYLMYRISFSLQRNG